MKLHNAIQNYISDKASFVSPAKGGLSPYTLAGYIKCWRAFFQWCIDRVFGNDAHIAV